VAAVGRRVRDLNLTAQVSFTRISEIYFSVHVLHLRLSISKLFLSFRYQKLSHRCCLLSILANNNVLHRVQMDFSDDEGDTTAAASAWNSNKAPVDFSTSGSEAEDNGSSAGQGKREKSSLSDRLKAWESDGEENGAASSSARSPSHSESQSSDGASRKRKGESDDTLTQLVESPYVSIEQGDSEATQPQSQAVGYPEKGRKLQKKGGRGAQDSDSDNDVFDEKVSNPQGTADTVLQQEPGSDEIGTGTGGDAPMGGISKASNTFRSRSMIVDSDED
jgi:hypothetical protein